MANPAAVAHISMALACWALGWRAYPYWINGILRASDQAAGGMFDPKALPPMAWISEVWRVPTLFLYPVAFVGSMALIIAGVRAIRQGSSRSYWPWVVIISSAVTLSSLIYCPNYGVWLLD